MHLAVAPVNAPSRFHPYAHESAELKAAYRKTMAERAERMILEAKVSREKEKRQDQSVQSAVECDDPANHFFAGDEP